MMRWTTIAILCLFLIMVDINFSQAGTKGKLGGVIKLFKKPSKDKSKPKSKDTTINKFKQPTQSNQGSHPQQPGSYPQQPGGYPNQGGYPQQPGGYPNQRGYPQQPGGYPNQGGYPQQPGGYPNQRGYPQQPGGYPYPGSYPQQPGYPGRSYPAGGYPAQGSPYGGGHGVYGGYPGGYINYNPNNKILSPHYGGSFGYGGYGGGRGSPFSHSVNALGYAPSDKSRGFGRTAVMAAAGGAMAGMALGYGLGRFPRPNFHFHSPEEEYYYNYYMYKKYGVRSTDGNDYSRDYIYSQTAEPFDKYMTSCMKRTDILPVDKGKKQNKPVTTATMTTDIPLVKTTTAAAATVINSNSISDNTTAKNPSPIGLSTLTPLNTSEVNPVSSASLVHNNKTVGAVETSFLVVNTTNVVETVSGPGNHSRNNNTTAEKNPPSIPHVQDKSEVEPSQPLKHAATDDDEDTVSIVEIGYPALIKQMKVRRCAELYVVYTEKQLKKKTTTPSSGGQRLQIGLGGHLSVVTSIILMILNINMQTVLHWGFH